MAKWSVKGTRMRIKVMVMRTERSQMDVDLVVVETQIVKRKKNWLNLELQNWLNSENQNWLNSKPLDGCQLMQSKDHTE